MESDLGWEILENGEYVLNLPRFGKTASKIVKLVEDDYLKNGGNIRELIYKNASSIGFSITSSQAERMERVAHLHINGILFFRELLSDPKIEEISLPYLGSRVYVYVRKSGWKATNVRITSEEVLKNAVNSLVRHTGRRITLKHPRINAVLEDGSRLHATLWPVSSGEITIRKFSKSPFSLSEWIESKSFPPECLAAIAFLMEKDVSLIVFGNTASGKTSLLNSLFTFIPRNERVVVIEETPEINIPHQHKCRLVCDYDREIFMGELIPDSLRMRPDRTVVGEVRSREEISALEEAITCGQARGTYSTMHGNSLDSGFSRLRSDVIGVCVRRVLRRRGKRIWEERALFEAGTRNVRFIRLKNGKPKLDPKAFVSIAENISDEDPMSGLKEREKLIRSCPKDFWRAFDYVQKHLYGL